MYHGGDVIDAVIVTILSGQWYRQAGRRMLRAPASLHVSATDATPSDQFGCRVMLACLGGAQ